VGTLWKLDGKKKSYNLLRPEERVTDRKKESTIKKNLKKRPVVPKEKGRIWCTAYNKERPRNEGPGKKK